MQYVRSLEQRVKQLEEDKSVLQARAAQGWEAPPGEIWENPNSPSENPHLGSRPEAVVRALQVLEVREQLEREGGHDGEKALVREMCNVSCLETIRRIHLKYCYFNNEGFRLSGENWKRGHKRGIDDLYCNLIPSNDIVNVIARSVPGRSEAGERI